MTSFDLIRGLRKRWVGTKMGHAGILDLPACGVVVVALGRATKFLPYLSSDKEYVFEVVFGIETDTFDIWGNVLREAPISFQETQLRDALQVFLGKFQQEVPPFSAKRDGGKRLYELAREDFTSVPNRTSEVEILALRMLEFSPGSFPRARLWMRCSAGTYVRSLAKQLGKNLGGFASAGFIVRIRAGRFTLEESQTLEEVLNGEEKLIPVEEALSDFPLIIISDRFLSLFFNGHSFPYSATPDLNMFFRVEDRRGNFLGLARTIGKSFLKAERTWK
jgi:tRNA pseudouridine55 synthase